MVHISVIIPVYNQERYLGDAIDSVLAQTYTDYELIVVDDGSTDGTPEVIASYGLRVRGFRKPNGGGASALNLGISQAQGDWIAWLSSDDLWEPHKLALQVEAIGQSPTVGLVFSDDLRIDSHGRVIGESYAWCPRTKLAQQVWLARKCFINGSTALIRHDVFDNVGLFDETERFAPDYDLWFRIVQRYDVLHIPEPLVRYRVHPGQTSTNVRAMRQAGKRVLIKGLRRMEATAALFGVAAYLMYQVMQLPWRVKNASDPRGTSMSQFVLEILGFLKLLTHGEGDA